MSLVSFYNELKKRNIFKVGTAYAVTAWLLAQIISLAASTFGAPDWLMKMVIIILTAGFPIALIIAWAFELTPDGVQRTSETNEQPSEAPPRRTLNTWIISILALSVAFLGIERIFFAESTLVEDNGQIAVAVLPFNDLSPGKDQQHFTDGMAEELINELTRISGLQVSGRTSAFQFRDDRDDAGQIAAQLSVNYLLKGSVRKAGDQLRITAQLIDVGNDAKIMWSEAYNRSYNTDGIFSIQSDITREVINELKVRLLPQEKEQLLAGPGKPTVDIEAYNNYLQGLSLSSSMNPGDLRKAIEFYNRAIALDPAFSLAYAKKSEAYFYLERYGNISLKDALKEQRSAAEWAMMTGKNKAATYFAQGLLYLNDPEISRELTREAFQKAYELQPNDPAIVIYRAISRYNKIAENKEFIREMKKAYELDPLSAFSNLYLGVAYEHRNEEKYYKMAEAQFRKAIELNPQMLEAYRELSALLGRHEGKPGEAIVVLLKARENIDAFSSVYNEIVTYSLMLDMPELAERYKNFLIRNFPENSFTFRAQHDIYMYHEQYDTLEAWIRENEDFMKNLSSFYYYQQLGEPYILRGDPEAYIRILEKEFPEFLNPENKQVVLNHEFGYMTLARAYIDAGQSEKAQAILDVFAAYYASLPQNELDDLPHFLNNDYVLYLGLLDRPEESYLRLSRAYQARPKMLLEWKLMGPINDLFYRLPEAYLQEFYDMREQYIAPERAKVEDFLRTREVQNATF